MTRPQDPHKRMKSSQNQYKDDNDRDFCNVQLSFIAEQYVYFDCAPIYTFSVDCLAVDLCGKLLSDKTGPFKIMKILLTTATIEKAGMLNSISIDTATLVSWVSNTELHDQYTSNQHDEERHESVDSWEGQPQKDELADALQAYKSDCIGCHIADGECA